MPEIEIQLLPMVYDDEGATLWDDSSVWEHPDFFDVEVRAVDPATGEVEILEEYEDFGNYHQAMLTAEKMLAKYPDAGFEDLYRPGPLVFL